MELLNCVYRFLDINNEIIYIGKAKNLDTRLKTHTHLLAECYDNIHKIEYITFNNEAEMSTAEIYYINKYKPKYNSASKWQGSLSYNIDILDDMKWNDYKGRYLRHTANNKVHININKSENNTNKKRKLSTTSNAYLLSSYTLEYYKQYILQKEEQERAYIYAVTHKKIILPQTGEIYDNLLEFYNIYKEYDPYLDLFYLYETCDNSTYYCTTHPYYNVEVSPMYYDLYCKYNGDGNNYNKMIEENTRKIICITTGEIFINVFDVLNKYNIKASRKYDIIQCCNNINTYVTIYNNKPMIWKWYDKYEKMAEKEITEYVERAQRAYNTRRKKKIA